MSEPMVSEAKNLTIREVRVILTAPARSRLIVVKVETSEPGLYGLGCATFTQRPLAVKAAVDDYLKPFLVGKDPQRIEDIWQTSWVNSYWRNGPVLNNAISGVDMALWDIKGKAANMPVYQLLGGASRRGLRAYGHASGTDLPSLFDSIRMHLDQGYKSVRVQTAVPGIKAVYGVAATAPHRRQAGGAIVATASLAGLTGVPADPVYAASKHAMQGFFDSLRIELRETGINVLVVSPGFVDTPIRDKVIGADGKEQGYQGRTSEKPMSVEECVAQIVSALDRRERELVMIRDAAETFATAETTFRHAARRLRGWPVAAGIARRSVRVGRCESISLARRSSHAAARRNRRSCRSRAARAPRCARPLR